MTKSKISALLRNDWYQRKNDVFIYILMIYKEQDKYEEVTNRLTTACRSCGFHLSTSFDCDIYDKRTYKKPKRKKNPDDNDKEEIFLYEIFKKVSVTSILYKNKIYPLTQRNINGLMWSLEILHNEMQNVTLSGLN